jgi:hypothetical protein
VGLAGRQTMLANRILTVVAGLLSWIVLPISIVTVNAGGCLVALTFGLLLLPLSLIWVVLFMGPLLGLSWLWEKTPLIRLLLAIIGIPVAALGYAYTLCIPSMGERESTDTKLNLCRTWPFSLDYLRYLRGELKPEHDHERWTRIQNVLWESGYRK